MTKRVVPDEEVPPTDPTITETVKCLLESLDTAGMNGTIKFHVYRKGDMHKVDLDATMCIPRSAFSLQKAKGKKG